MRRFMKAALAASVIATAMLAGCVQFPTEKQGVVDLRPQLSFRLTDHSTTAQDARILVDGLDVGRVGDYLDGGGALRVLSGNHVVRVYRDGQILLDEKVYLGDGVNRAFILN